MDPLQENIAKGIVNIFETHVRTRHTNADYPERMSDDELKQSAIFMATFA